MLINNFSVGIIGMALAMHWIRTQSDHLMSAILMILSCRASIEILVEQQCASTCSQCLWNRRKYLFLNNAHEPRYFYTDCNGHRQQKQENPSCTCWRQIRVRDFGVLLAYMCLLQRQGNKRFCTGCGRSSTFWEVFMRFISRIYLMNPVVIVATDSW